MKANILLVMLNAIAYKGFSQKNRNVQEIAGFMTMSLVDSSRIYKPDTPLTDALHYRPLDLDIWYPARQKSSKKLLFKDLFSLFEKRANKYQDNEDYTGIMEEMAQFFVAGLGLEATQAKALLSVETSSYENAPPAVGKWPVIIYMAGFNGMGFENFRILEDLAKNGYFVVSISSIGRYPGDMTNDKLDMMEQVYDAELVIRNLKEFTGFDLEIESLGVLGCSWGGMSAAVLLDRNPLIRAMVSLDGSETHYFGDSEIDDNYLDEIHQAQLMHPEITTCPYLFLESGNKLEAFTPTTEYHYFKKTNAPKSYLRFMNGKHEDFLSIPSLLEVSEQAINTHQMISRSSLLFFNHYLKNEVGFHTFYRQLLKREDITDKPYEVDGENSQRIIFTGEISDAKSDEKLPYVNIGVLNRDLGTVSDTEGAFKLKLDKSYMDDTIRISMIGYKAQVFLIRDLYRQKSNIQVALVEDIPELSEVVITAENLKSKILGNKTDSKFLSTGFFYDQLGAEMGIRINVRKTPTFIDAFNFHISYNRLSAKSFFRLNIYNISEGKPSRNILQKNIVIPIAAKQVGLVTVDLKKYDLVLKNDVIVTLEWVDNEGEPKKGEGIYFSLGLFSRGTYVRNSSQGKMKRHRGFGVGFNMDVRY
ncbi:carboxypeptidase-like regulatory domain-containing protein [Fulvivirgaceae bacterium BMA12]|uniref:Carboxypeptidase-like regulatory domain-containing protein n=1 Tax=Agaribacillus aureus TaxID=3051825 RepID=A0ABT8L3B8_9BACT|nr:carboxypeptidase-like regulatory domain-containing protein [Fulvivirgaceae bacterium BMA12]